MKFDRGGSKFLRGFVDIQSWTKWMEHNQGIPTLCFVGRSNVGKSSLINALFGKKMAKVSNTPGRTREINLFQVPLDNDRYFYFLDLPGYGHAQVSREMSRSWNDLMAQFFQTLNNDFLVAVLQDARHPLQTSDKAFIKFFDKSLAPQIFVFNKIDKLKKQKDRAAFKKIVKEEVTEYIDKNLIFKVSAETRENLDQLEDYLYEFVDR